MNSVTELALWVYNCRKESTRKINPYDFIVYEDQIKTWEKKYIKRNGLTDPQRAGKVIARLYKIFILDEFY